MLSLDKKIGKGCPILERYTTYMTDTKWFSEVKAKQDKAALSKILCHIQEKNGIDTKFVDIKAIKKRGFSGVL